MTDLKPCPFCGNDGSDPSSPLNVHSGSVAGYVHCQRCGAFGPDGSLYSGLAGATETWNQRADQPQFSANGEAGEPTIPSEQELKTFACEWWRTFGFIKDKATCEWVLNQVAPEHFADFARDVLARWGTAAPQPPVDDEGFEFIVSDPGYCVQASGDAPTLRQAIDEGRHYLAQYAQDGPHILEVRHVKTVFTESTEEDDNE